MIIGKESCFDITRSLFYTWAMLECFILAYLYHFGYDKIKKTYIIGSLKMVFVSLGLLFFYLSIIPIIRLFDQDAREWLVYLISVPVIIVIHCLRRFRKWSLEQRG